MCVIRILDAMEHPAEILGLSTEAAGELATTIEEGCVVARVIAVDRGRVLVDWGAGPHHAELTGHLRFVTDSELELPAVGDWVEARPVDETMTLVSRVLPRRSMLRRRRPGKQSTDQMVAANIDLAFVLHAADAPVHVRRLERYLVALRDGNIEPVIVLSKADLMEPGEVAAQLVRARDLAEALAVTSLGEGGATALQDRLQPLRTYALLGPSGVGKSTLLNRLLGEDRFDTQSVREGDKRGRHTTTRRQLVVLPGGAMIVDTPGMREFGMTDMGAGIETQFDEIHRLAESCRFDDCGHSGEPGCAVQAAVADGELAPEALESYLRLGREAAHYERSHLEARRRDKAFGKMVRTIKNEKKDRR